MIHPDFPVNSIIRASRTPTTVIPRHAMASMPDKPPPAIPKRPTIFVIYSLRAGEIVLI